jgi:recombination protein RecT
MIRLACTEFAKNEDLQQCTQLSVYAGIIQAAQLGLEIGVLGQGYLIPFWNNKKRVHEAQFIPGYKGLITLARRSGEVTSIETNIVYARDTFDLTLGLESSLKHVPYLDGDRGAARLVYGVAKFKDGGYHLEWMTIAEVNTIRARSKTSDTGPWKTDYEQMVRKTVIRRMMNYLPMSIELQTALQIDEAVEQGKRATLEGDVVVVSEENDPPPDDPAAPTAETVHQETGEVQDATTAPPESAPPQQTDQWEPTPEEQAAIHAREMVEASGQPAPPSRARRALVME